MNIAMWACLVLFFMGFVFFVKAFSSEKSFQDLDEYDDPDDWYGEDEETKRINDTDTSDLGGFNAKNQ